MERGRGFGHGKVLLFGEHAVVYGQPALAAALDVGVEVVACPARERSLCLEGEDGAVIARVGGEERLGCALERVAAVVSEECGPFGDVGLKVRSALPLGAGLGSSAALSVAVARALMQSASRASANPLQTVLRAADSAERVFHGNPSGVDHTVSALGGVLVYTRGAAQPFRAVKNVPKLPIFVAQMEPGADTGAMVGGVRTRWEKNPKVMSSLFQWMGDLTREAEEALQHDDPAYSLGALMNLAHGALVSIGVSTLRLDRGCHAVREAGAWGAKLTGAGGGGCIVAIAPQEAHRDVHDALLDVGAYNIFSSTLADRT